MTQIAKLVGGAAAVDAPASSPSSKVKVSPEKVEAEALKAEAFLQKIREGSPVVASATGKVAEA